MPVIAMSTSYIAQSPAFTRGSIDLETIAFQFIRTARAKGLRNIRINSQLRCVPPIAAVFLILGLVVAVYSPCCGCVFGKLAVLASISLMAH